jgi:hypothetical protein
LNAAKTTDFLLDDNQVVRTGEIGSVSYIRKQHADLLASVTATGIITARRNVDIKHDSQSLVASLTVPERDASPPDTSWRFWIPVCSNRLSPRRSKHFAGTKQASLSQVRFLLAWAPESIPLAGPHAWTS